MIKYVDTCAIVDIQTEQDTLQRNLLKLGIIEMDYEYKNRKILRLFLLRFY